MWSIFGVTFMFILSVTGETLDNVEVTIAQGIVVGSKASDGEYFEFHGIPYADSTSGRNRFKAPSAPPLFNDVFVANRKDVKCIRALRNGYEGSEDCLVANVFTPDVNTSTPLPVMVWIKGTELDQFEVPDLSYINFMQKDVVVVSLNYRESVLGFLCLGTETAPGNAGLKDIIAGLKWIRDNIVQFGGDPENICLFGHGSGAAAVDLVSLSPMSDGLIHSVITQSGSALSPWAVTRDNIKYAIDVAEALGHEVTNIIQLSDVFARTHIAALMAVINELDLTDNSLAFAPCIENVNLEYGEPFLLQSPYEILIKGEYTNIPFMAGFVDKEGTIRAEEALKVNWFEKMDDSFVDFIQSDLIFDDENVQSIIVNEIKYFYFGEQSIDNTKIEEFLSYQGDTMILVSILREVRMRAISSTSLIYLYQFSYKGPLGEPFVGPLSIDRAAHSEELAYLFTDFSKTETNEMDLTVSDILIERWTNFAKTGIPESDTSTVNWQPFTSENYNYLRILGSDEVDIRQGGSLEMPLEDPHSETMTFWEEIYEEHFLDAQGRWNINDRDEGDDNGEESSGEVEGGEEDEGGDEGEDNGEGSGEEGEIEEEEGSGETDEDDDNSANTAVGYTFLIISLFAILGNYHMSHLIS